MVGCRKRQSGYLHAGCLWGRNCVVYAYQGNAAQWVQESSATAGGNAKTGGLSGGSQMPKGRRSLSASLSGSSNNNQTQLTTYQCSKRELGRPLGEVHIDLFFQNPRLLLPATRDDRSLGEQ